MTQISIYNSSLNASAVIAHPKRSGISNPVDVSEKNYLDQQLPSFIRLLCKRIAGLCNKFTIAVFVQDRVSWTL